MKPSPTVIVFGGVAAALMALLRLNELLPGPAATVGPWRVVVPALAFLVVGLWVGRQRSAAPAGRVLVLPPVPFGRQASKGDTGISPRELQVLQRVAAGLSNQEIAEELFISLSTVKSHLGSLFVKLDARRRTEAVSKARALGLVP